MTTPTSAIIRMAMNTPRPPLSESHESPEFTRFAVVFSTAMVDVVSVRVGQEQPVDAAGVVAAGVVAAGVDAAGVVAAGVVAATVGHVVSHAGHISPGNRIVGHVELSLPTIKKFKIICRGSHIYIHCLLCIK